MKNFKQFTTLMLFDSNSQQNVKELLSAAKIVNKQKSRQDFADFFVSSARKRLARPVRMGEKMRAGLVNALLCRIASDGNGKVVDAVVAATCFVTETLEGSPYLDAHTW